MPSYMNCVKQLKLSMRDIMRNLICDGETLTVRGGPFGGFVAEIRDGESGQLIAQSQEEITWDDSIEEAYSLMIEENMREGNAKD